MKANKTQRKTGFQHGPLLPDQNNSNHDLNTQIVSPDSDLMPAPSNPSANVAPHPNWVAPTTGSTDQDAGGW